MALSLSTRLGLTRWGASTDPLTRAQLDGDNAKLDATVVMFAEGNLADRPAAGTNGRLYDAQDVGLVYYDTGTAWVALTEPAGVIKFVAGTTAPGNTTAADGRVVDRAGTYARVFAAIGTTHNTGGETSTQFRLPDYRDRVLVGASASKPVGWKNTTGETHTLTVAQLPSHNHPGSITGDGGAHTPTMQAAGSHSHGGATGGIGANHVHVPYGGGGYFLFTGGAGNGTSRWFKLTDTSDPGRIGVAEGSSTHTESADHGHGISADGSHTHTINAVGNHNHAVTVAAQGGGAAFNIMQPSAAVLVVVTI